MSERDYYEVLGVDRGASAAELKKAFRRLAMKPKQRPAQANQTVVDAYIELLGKEKDFQPGDTSEVQLARHPRVVVAARVSATSAMCSGIFLATSSGATAAAADVRSVVPICAT